MSKMVITSNTLETEMRASLATLGAAVMASLLPLPALAVETGNSVSLAETQAYIERTINAHIISVGWNPEKFTARGCTLTGEKKDDENTIVLTVPLLALTDVISYKDGTLDLKGSGMHLHIRIGRNPRTSSGSDTYPPSYPIPLSDAEMSRRVANALKHAAELCKAAYQPPDQFSAK